VLGERKRENREQLSLHSKLLTGAQRRIFIFLSQREVRTLREVSGSYFFALLQFAGTQLPWKPQGTRCCSFTLAIGLRAKS
jgi:hypothetical protein